MSTTVINNWVPTDLPVSSKKTSLVDDIADIVFAEWEKDANDFRALAASTDADDAVEGTVTIDKILLARLIKQAAGEDTRVGKAKVGDIARVMHHAFKRYGIDRRSIASSKAAYQAVEQGRTIEPGHVDWEPFVV